jgi:3-mercaptopyruvate sulfurtransferase SseA
MITSRRALLSAMAVLAATAAVGADAPAAVGRVGLAEFKKDYDQGKVVLIDVRAAESFRNGHIPGSMNVPLGSLSEHVARLKAAKKPIVAYCA